TTSGVVTQKGWTLSRLPRPESDICARRHRNAPTSVTADESIVHVKAILRQSVLDLIAARGEAGLIVEEVSSRLNMRYTSASARVSELKATGAVVDTGRRRKTSSGRMAAVVVA